MTDQVTLILLFNHFPEFLSPRDSIKCCKHSHELSAQKTATNQFSNFSKTCLLMTGWSSGVVGSVVASIKSFMSQEASVVTLHVGSDFL